MDPSAFPFVPENVRVQTSRLGVVINHNHQQSRFHTRGRTSEAEGELLLERKGLPRPQKVSKEVQSNRSN